MKNLFIALALVFASVALAQNPYKVQFSDAETLKGSNECYTDGIIGETKKYIYVSFDHSTGFNANYTLKAYDKSTLRESKRVSLFENDKEAKDYLYTGAYQTKDGFIYFFEKEKKGVVKLFATTIDENLKIKDKLNPVFEFNEDEMDMRVLQASTREDFVVLTQEFVDEGEEIVVDYVLYSNKFKPLNKGKINTGLYSTISKKKAVRRSRDILGDYRLTENGEIVSLSRTRRDKNDASTEYFNLVFTNAASGTTDQIPVTLENAAFDEYVLLEKGDELVISGFYMDQYEKDKLFGSGTKTKKTFRINGTFLKRYNVATHELIGSNQIKIDEVLANRIANGNPATRGGLFKAEKDDTDLSTRYNITDVIYNAADKKATFYCEYKYNYQTTSSRTVNGVTTTTTTYHSVRGNLFYFQISLETGEILWYENIRKYSHLTSASSYIYYATTVNVVPGKTSDYVFYTTYRFFDENNPNDLSGEKFKAKKLTSAYVTAVINRKNGKAVHYKPEMSDKSRLKAHEKVNFANIYIADDPNVFYTINSSHKLKYGKYLMAAYFGIFSKKLRSNLTKETFTIAKVTAD